MVNEGPTTAATLIAKFKGDTSDVLGKIETVKAAAIELGAIDPTVSIDEHGAASTIAKIEGVEAAADGLGKANERLRVSSNRLAQANQGHLQQWQLIALVIASLIPLMGPLLGYTVAVSGALGGMGAAGVLAVLGIKRAMQDGTATGAVYRDGLTKLQGVLHTLEDSSAAAMLTSFSVAVGSITRALPSLNGQVSTFAGLLGSAGSYALTGIINLLRIANPLFVAGGRYVLTLAQNFERWTLGGQLQRFVSYSLTQLPQVERMLGNLAAAVVHVVQALSPLGNVAIQALGILAGMLRDLPSDQLLTIVAGAAAGYVAFQSWQKLVPILAAVAEGVGAVNLATSLSGGAVGIAVAAIGALAGIFAGAALATDTATQSEQNYTAAIEAANGAIDENVKKIAAKALLDDGSLAAAKKLGIATSLVVEATLGNAAAQDLLQQKLAAAEEQYNGFAKGQHGLTLEQRQGMDAVTTLTAGYAEQSGAIQQTIADNNLLAGSLNTVALTTGITKTQFDELKKSIDSIPDHVAVGITLTGDGHLIYSDARNQHEGHAGGGTVGGVGSTTSDSNLIRASRGEEVIQASSAAKVRPLLKAINANPDVVMRMLASSSSTSYTYPTTMIVQADPTDAFTDFQRRQNLRAA